MSCLPQEAVYGSWTRHPLFPGAQGDSDESSQRHHRTRQHRTGDIRHGRHPTRRSDCPREGKGRWANEWRSFVTPRHCCVCQERSLNRYSSKTFIKYLASADICSLNYLLLYRTTSQLRHHTDSCFLYAIASLWLLVKGLVDALPNDPLIKTSIGTACPIANARIEAQ